MDNIINIDDSAVEKVHTLILEEDNPELKLRVFVQGGGCSGFQYGFTFEEDVSDDDFVIIKETSDSQIKFLIDPMSAQYLTGAKISYISDLSGDQFVIQNPNASTTCGCGSSFSV